jgi:hypothetical protein
MGLLFHLTPQGSLRISDGQSFSLNAKLTVDDFRLQPVHSFDDSSSVIISNPPYMPPQTQFLYHIPPICGVTYMIWPDNSMANRFPLNASPHPVPDAFLLPRALLLSARYGTLPQA